MKTKYIQKIKQLIQDKLNAELKSNKTDVKAVVTELPIDFFENNLFYSDFPVSHIHYPT